MIVAAWALAPFPTPAERYTPYEAVLAGIAVAAADKPGAVHEEIIGTTRLGEPIRAFHVTEPGVPVERTVLVLGGIHALEWISTETAFLLLADLVAVPPRGVRVTVVPVLNVDGRLRTEADIRLGNNVYRRGNTRGVDLNRDFAVNREATSLWRHVLPGYPATSYLYAPWTGRWARPPDHAAFVTLGREMEGAQGTGACRSRQLSRWGFFFRAQGTEIDHLYGRYGTLAWLVELTRSGFDPLHPATSLSSPFRWYNPEDPRPRTERGVAALRALIGTDP